MSLFERILRRLAVEIEEGGLLLPGLFFFVRPSGVWGDIKYRAHRYDRYVLVIPTVDVHPDPCRDNTLSVRYRMTRIRRIAWWMPRLEGRNWGWWRRW